MLRPGGAQKDVRLAIIEKKYQILAKNLAQMKIWNSDL